MSFSLQVANGDLVLGGSQLVIVFGVDKLKQDLQLWVTERFGIDRFHPVMGSRLQDYIGTTINYNTQSKVYSEILRVLSNYQKVQYQGLRQNPTLYSLSELCWSINDIQVAVGFDRAMAAINVSNGERDPLSINLSQGV